MGKTKCFVCNGKASGDHLISLHKFPKRNEVSKKWKDALSLTDVDDVANLYICSIHFARDDLKIANGKDEKKRIFLQPQAIPILPKRISPVVHKRVSEKDNSDKNPAERTSACSTQFATNIVNGKDEKKIIFLQPQAMSILPKPISSEVHNPAEDNPVRNVAKHFSGHQIYNLKIVNGIDGKNRIFLEPQEMPILPTPISPVAPKLVSAEDNSGENSARYSSTTADLNIVNCKHEKKITFLEPQAIPTLTKPVFSVVRKRVSEIDNLGKDAAEHSSECKEMSRSPKRQCPGTKKSQEMSCQGIIVEDRLRPDSRSVEYVENTDSLPAKSDSFNDTLTNPEPSKQNDYHFKEASAIGSYESEPPLSCSPTGNVSCVLDSDEVSSDKDENCSDAVGAKTARRFYDPRYLSEISEIDFSSPKRRRQTLNLIKRKDEDYRKKIKALQSLNRYSNKRISLMKQKVESLKTNGLLSKVAKESLLITQMCKKSDFLMELLKRRRGKFGEKIRSFALTLYSYSPRGYRYVRETLGDDFLPSPSTVRSWYPSVEGSSGLIKQEDEAIAERSSQEASVISSPGFIKEENDFSQEVVISYTGCTKEEEAVASLSSETFISNLGFTTEEEVVISEDITMD